MKSSFLALIIFFISITGVKSQISFSELVQESTVKKETYNLFFVDFWATWCIPCSYATTHINQIRDSFPNELYVATISEEQPNLILNYLEKHPNNLDVYSDADGETFNSFKITSLPSGVLFNSKGHVLWKGNPADFSLGLLNKFLRTNRSKGKVDGIFKRIAPLDDEEDSSSYIPVNDFEIKNLGKSQSNKLIIKEESTYTYFEGSLKSILSHVLKVSSSQITTSNTNMYAIYLKNDLSNFLQNLVLTKLGLDVEQKQELKQTLLFNVEAARLWDSNQINWGNNEINYLLGEEDLEADNMGVNDFFKLIANTRNEPFSIVGKYDQDSKHDWQIHYKYFEFLKSSLEDGFGIKLTIENLKIPMYYISEK